LRFGVLAKPKRFRKNQNPWSTCRVTLEIEMTLHQNAVRLVAKNFRVHQTVHLNGTAMSIARQFGFPDHIVCPTPISSPEKRNGFRRRGCRH